MKNNYLTFFDALERGEEVLLRAEKAGTVTLYGCDCGRMVRALDLIDVRGINLPGIEAADFICDACWSKGPRNAAAKARGRRAHGPHDFTHAQWQAALKKQQRQKG